MIVLVLTVCLVTGLAGAADPAFAVSSSKSPFANTKSSYQHNGRFDGNLIVHGVDVSYFQSMSSDWNKAKRNQCDYAIMRVTYTTYGNGSLNVDSKFATHFTKARAAGVMRGVYVFSQAKNAAEAEKEAQYAINRLKALGIGPKERNAFQRIAEMEEIFERVTSGKGSSEDLKVLEKYYTSADWKKDFALDEAGLLPAGLKRGVLSEDGIYNLLS